MQKRNLTFLIIILVAITAGFFGYLYFSKPANTGEMPSNTPRFNFFPFDKTPKKPAPETPADTSPSGIEIPNFEIQPVTVLKLKKVSSFPVAGFGVYQKEVFKELLPLPPGEGGGEVNLIPTAPATEFVATLRYVEKATGNVYQTRADQLDERKFTNTIIPQIHEAFFGSKATAVAMRYLKGDGKTIETFLGSLPKDILGGDSSQTAQVKGTFLPENITDMSVSPDSSKIFYLVNINNTSVGVTAGALGESKSQVFGSPFTEWLSQWPNFKMITVTTKPASGVPGYMYAINPDRKDFSKILGGINGLTTLTSPSGKLVLYSSSSGNSLNLSIYDTDTGNSSLLGVKTLPEKCVWTKASDALYCAVPKFLNLEEYPDTWYQGLVTFSDEIWEIDAVDGSGQKIADPALISNEEVDGIKLALDDSENYLFFLNKKDSYLWELNLK